MAGRDKRKLYDFRDKAYNVDTYIFQMMNRLQSMFEWGNLPDTITPWQIEKTLQLNGTITWLNIDESEIKQYPEDSRNMPGGLYALYGNLGGVEDFNSFPVFSIVAHPRLISSLQKKIDEDCVVMKNDSYRRGLWDLHLKYATALVDNDLSMQIADIASRALTIATVGDDREKRAFEEYIKELGDGNLSAIVGNVVMDSIKLQPYADSVHEMLTNLTEYHQYLRANWFQDVGLHSNNNMKREAIMTPEANLVDDMLMPFVDDMLSCRKEAVEKINAMFGTNITVEFSSAWRNNNEAITNGAVLGEENEENEQEQEEIKINGEEIEKENNYESEQETITGNDELAGSEDNPAIEPELGPETDTEDNGVGDEGGTEVNINININTEGEVEENEDGSSDTDGTEDTDTDSESGDDDNDTNDDADSDSEDEEVKEEKDDDEDDK